ncbi:Required for respiratory growth protein 9 [Apiospora marii]|uniref:Required for respiratory growth protein 9, mitochondrial n=1 Tax=Apiospora marii TaxID=335849 RepID=A0ABR1RBC8_9PEZI
MICSCRSASLRIFVQSLTPLQLPAATHRLNPSSLAAASRQDGLVRSFRTASAACYPRQPPHHVPRHDDPQHPQEQDLAGFSSSYGAGSVSYADPEVPVVELDNAQNSGAVFELSQDTIDALSAESERLSVAPSRGPKTGRNRADSPKSKRDLKEPREQPYKTKHINVRSRDREAEREPDNRPQKKKEAWQIQKEALKEKFPEGWAPRKRLSPDALDGIKALHAQFPKEYTTPVLAAKFKVSPEVIRRILRAKWEPTVEQEEDRQDRWFTRGKNIWSQMAELGKKPPKRWRAEGITRDPKWNMKRGPRTEYPYVPKWKEDEAKKERDDKESAQRKLGGSLL